MSLFRKHYLQSVFEEGKEAHIVEANQDCTPIKIDLDFHYNLSAKEVKSKHTRVYTEKHIK